MSVRARFLFFVCHSALVRSWTGDGVSGWIWCCIRELSKLVFIGNFCRVDGVGIKFLKIDILVDINFESPYLRKRFMSCLGWENRDFCVAHCASGYSLSSGNRNSVRQDLSRRGSDALNLWHVDSFQVTFERHCAREKKGTLSGAATVILVVCTCIV